MSIWISRICMAGVLTGLAACQPVAGLPQLGLMSAPEPVAVLNGSLRVAAPAGYCPDPATLREDTDSAVVFLGRCEAENGMRPAVLTVTAGASGSGIAMASGGEGLAAFFNSDAGRSTLSRSGQAADVSVGSSLTAEDLFLMRVDDRATGSYWRAMMALGGRLVSISANGPDLPLSEGRALVEKTAAALRRANPRP
jgi:hypothetical protein